MTERGQVSDLVNFHTSAPALKPGRGACGRVSGRDSKTRSSFLVLMFRAYARNAPRPGVKKTPVA